MLEIKPLFKEINDRFERANPNCKKCMPKRKAHFQKMKGARSRQIALNESQHNARRTLDLKRHLSALDLSELQLIEDSSNKLKEYEVVFGIHKLISANVDQKLKINAFIDHLDKIYPEQDYEDGTD